MRVLPVYCHPRDDSFCAAVRDTAIAALHAGGHAVELRDLYAEGFVPALTSEQRGLYYHEATNLAGIEDHVAALRRADALLLVYPTWWFGLPAMLKGWFDRVWVPGVAFHLRANGGGLQPLLTNIRRIGVVTTYGSPQWLLWFVRWPNWRMIHHGFRPLCAQRAKLDWIALPRMDTCTMPERARFLARVKARLSRWR